MRCWMIFGMVALISAPAAGLAQGKSSTMAQTPTVQQRLEEFVEDYRRDPMAMNGAFGIKVGDEWWNVSVKRRQETRKRGRLTDHVFGPHDVVLRKGQPTTPTWYFALADRSVLERIATGSVAAGTAAMQSFGSDKVAVETGDMNGYVSGARGSAEMYHALNHFWTKGIPEVTRFGRNQSMPTHGVGTVALYMIKGNRILWFSMLKDEVANKDPRLEAGQVPNIFIVTKGRGRAKLGDREIDVEAGMSVFVAPFVKHVIWNPHDEPMEGFVILLGDNEDAAFGKSYLDIQEDLLKFYGTLPPPPK